MHTKVFKRNHMTKYVIYYEINFYCLIKNVYQTKTAWGSKKGAANQSM